MSGDLRPVAARSHVAPAAPPGGGAVDEAPAAPVVGAHAHSAEVVLREIVGQRAGDRGARLGELVADLRDGEPASVLRRLDLVVVEAVAHRRVEALQLSRGGLLAIGDATGHVVEDRAEVTEGRKACVDGREWLARATQVPLVQP